VLPCQILLSGDYQQNGAEQEDNSQFERCPNGGRNLIEGKAGGHRDDGYREQARGSRSCATFRDASYFCFSASVRWFHSHSKSSSDIMVPRAPLRLGRWATLL
jgi:hypothetical protein